MREEKSERLRVYMHPGEFAQVVTAIAAVGARRFLEWGSGGSTHAILRRFPSIERYVSIEHHREWYETVRDAIDDPRLSLRHVPPDAPPPEGASRKQIIAWDAAAEQDRSILESYVSFPATLGETFDAVLVDGRARRFCIAAGFELLRPGGILLLHDAQRVEYHDALRSVGEPVFVEPFDRGQVALVRKP